jgi:uncharacterized UPF0160 family protein
MDTPYDRYSEPCERPEECRTRVSIDDHHEESCNDESDNEVPLSSHACIVDEYPTKKNQKSSHRVRTVEESLEAAHIGSVDPVEYRRDTVASLPIRWIATITEGEEEIF